MSVDKFGHFSNSHLLKRNVPKVLGIFIDRYSNLDIQNRKIKNLAPPSEDTDAVNKVYIQTQISRTRDSLIKDLEYIREEITNLKNDIQDLNKILMEIMTRDHET